MAPNHLNNIEQVLIYNLRDGTYNTIAGIGSGSAWTDADVTVFGQFPTTDETKYPCIITEMIANGIETQYMGQNLTDRTGAAAKGELYGVGFNIYVMVDRASSITISGSPYRERRLINYLMLNCANVLTDCDFTNISPQTEVEERHFSGFRDVGYNAELETWVAIASMVVIFKNSR
jgi:hypothetical protein